MDNQEQAILKGRLNGKQRNKLKGLFNMLYTPRELADEIEINIDKIYNVYIRLGCPNERDQRKHILINGKAFANWYSLNFSKTVLAPDETFCKTCRMAVKIIQPVEQTKNKLTYALSICPTCGRQLTKIISCNKGK